MVEGVSHMSMVEGGVSQMSMVEGGVSNMSMVEGVSKGVLVTPLIINTLSVKIHMIKSLLVTNL
ncbi:hypothetical protein CWI37_1246p0020 [Hamiltosporidium tvaerminnensis]|uniref:Uncharacterized protein n=1 Tax=Hamiltosporidium tvaerminnensis TaxID=1176355 RepID=A0A4Q9KXQ0_9MICR|nr:hypothetical protein CWI37_1246p0020 [Hamiltosporidium tvaerminnensis]